MRTTRLQLADGRELIHFDDDPSADRLVEDSRPLGGRAMQGELRYDALLDEWVSVATHRNDRTFLPAADDCPLCPTRPGHLSEIPASDYDVVVFENRFPSLVGPPADPEEHAGFLTRPAAGRCEVVCFTPDHEGSFASLSTDKARLVVDAWAQRTAELSELPGVEQVFVFENRGESIGVTLRHPHGQIYAYPYITPRTRRQLDSVRWHGQRTGQNLFDALVEAELKDGARVVLEGEHWVAFVPFAARYPVEVHLYPRVRVPDLAALSDEARDELAVVYLDLLRRGDRFYEQPLPYISAWHQAPVHDGRDIGALHLELFSVQRSPDKIKYLAGSESAMGAFINDRAPEDVADRLRKLAT